MRNRTRFLPPELKKNIKPENYTASVPAWIALKQSGTGETAFGAGSKEKLMLGAETTNTE